VDAAHNPNAWAFIIGRYERCGYEISDEYLEEYYPYPRHQMELALRTPDVDIMRKLHAAGYNKELARNPHLSPDIKAELISSRDYEVQIALAKNPNLTLADLIELFTKIQLEQRTPKFSIELLEALISHPNTSLEFLDQLFSTASDEHLLPSTAKHFAQNKNTSETILLAIHKYLDKTNVGLILEHPNCPAEIRQELRLQQLNAQWGPKQPRTYWWWDEVTDAEAEETDPADLSRDLRRARTITSSEVLDDLACHSELSVRRNVAKNPKASAAALERLAQEKSLRRIVAANPAVPLNVLVKIGYQDLEFARLNPSLVEAMFAVATREDTIARDIAAAINATDADELASLFKSPEPKVRREVAKNPHATTSLLREAQSDSDFSVGWSANSQLQQRFGGDCRAIVRVQGNGYWADLKIDNRLTLRFNGTRDELSYYRELSATDIEVLDSGSLGTGKQPSYETVILSQMATNTSDDALIRIITTARDFRTVHAGLYFEDPTKHGRWEATNLRRKQGWANYMLYYNDQDWVTSITFYFETPIHLTP